ncbi:MAG: DUF2399 domain-containing protein [Acidimicrobiaceae bacterium]|nr:DUF2399 domain-containing protein [Acidimicrobiaceae bacterium]MYG55813.1 DUF2399 domain-containing protein [Acidimicrobiaceae bacterium]MYJ97929.1 DUF2399 domain-containing protein [Acidimicrobiaceae bacterium]
MALRCGCPSRTDVAVVTSARSIPESLSSPGLRPLWELSRRRLDRYGLAARGRIARPDLDQSSELTLESLLGHGLTKGIDLAELETALLALDVGEDLCDALARLGFPASPAAVRRRAERSRARSSRSALARAVATWEEPWAPRWADSVVGAGLLSGLDDGDVSRLAEDVRALLDQLDRAITSSPDRSGPSVTSADGLAVAETAGGFTVSRTELAAALFGSSHALDRGTRLASLVTHALRCRIGEPLDGRELWEAAGIQMDRVSAPVLAWSVPAMGDSPLDEMMRSAAAGGLPLHVSLLSMLRYSVRVPEGTLVLVVENPRLVEAAAERTLPGCMVAANGNPTTAVTTLLRQMQASGAAIRYHGDFDAAGIGICRRMHEFGCTPWMMDADDYNDAVRFAEVNGVRLERDTRDCGATPWDPNLQAAFECERFVIHEEFVLDSVLEGFARQPPGHATGPNCLKRSLN